MPLRGMIFDIDGTLVDTTGHLYADLDHALEIAVHAAAATH